MQSVPLGSLVYDLMQQRDSEQLHRKTKGCDKMIKEGI